MGEYHLERRVNHDSAIGEWEFVQDYASSSEALRAYGSAKAAGRFVDYRVVHVLVADYPYS